MLSGIKKFLATAIVSVLFVSAANGSHNENGHFSSTVNPKYRVVVIRDEWTPILSGQEQATWRTQRDAVLSAYEAGRVAFIVKETAPTKPCEATAFGPRGSVRVCKTDASWTWWKRNWDDHIVAAITALELPHQGVFCHELGHALGLGHSDSDYFTDPTCMMHWQDTLLPNQHDIDALLLSHRHGD